MTSGARRWTIRLTQVAEADFREILLWTVDQFGEAQARAYAETISAALTDLTAGPTVAGVRERDDIGKGLSTFHVARKGRKGRHFVLFRRGGGRDVIDVLRLLHDAMDLPRHVPPEDSST